MLQLPVGTGWCLLVPAFPAGISKTEERFRRAHEHAAASIPKQPGFPSATREPTYSTHGAGAGSPSTAPQVAAG